MRTVKEISGLTGISVRTLHYYDEIGLLKPTKTTDAGYRLYDDKALEVLQQILFFKEFDMPLKEIMSVMQNPALDRNQLLSAQKNILILKKDRLERIILSIESILKGENKMDFEIFSKSEIENLYNAITTSMTEEQKEILIGKYGSLNQFQDYFMETAASEQSQKNYAKMIEWYGDKESALSIATNPLNSEIMAACGKRYEAILRKLAAKTGTDPSTFEVKAIVGELDFVSKQLYRMKDMTAFMLELANSYLHDKTIQERLDKEYGESSTQFIGNALTTFYKHD